MQLLNLFRKKATTATDGTETIHAFNEDFTISRSRGVEIILRMRNGSINYTKLCECIGSISFRRLKDKDHFQQFVEQYYNYKNSTTSRYIDIEDMIFTNFPESENDIIGGIYGPKWILDYVLISSNVKYYSLIHKLIEAADDSSEDFESRIKILKDQLKRKQFKIDKLIEKIDRQNDLLLKQNEMMKEQTQLIRQQREDAAKSKTDIEEWMKRLSETVSETKTMKSFKPVFSELQNEIAQQLHLEIQQLQLKLNELLLELHPNATKVWFNRAYRTLHINGEEVSCDILRGRKDKHVLTEEEIRKLTFK